MNYLFIFYTSLISFVVTLILSKPLMKYLKKVGLVAYDMQKKNKPLLPTSAGLLILPGILGAIYFAIFFSSLTNSLNTLTLLSTSSSIILGYLIGLFDDLNNRSKFFVETTGIKDIRIGLKQWQKPLLSIPIAVPLIASRIGNTSMVLPLIGQINFGILYSVVLVPIGTVAVVNAYNMLAGMNGLEGSLGMIAFTSLGIFCLINNRYEGAILAFSTVASLIVYLYYNKYPAKLLPGDSLTYLLGAVYITVVIISNIEKFGAILFAPWIIEFLLKVRSKFKAASLGILTKEGYLKSRYKKIYSLTHLAMKFKLKEWQITLFIDAIAILFAILAFATSL